MTSPEPTYSQQVLSDSKNFSLVLGGPLFQLLRRAHLSDDAYEEVQRRVVAFVLICWVPLLLLSALDGKLFGHAVAVPFVRDLETHVRFLVVVPLLIYAELMVHRRMLPLARTFLDRNLIPEEALPRFDAVVLAAVRLRNSVPAELLLLLVVYVVGVFIVWRGHTILHADTWYATPLAQGERLSPAGVWYGYLSLPIFQFLLLRWYFRLFIWTRFLWQVSRIKLALVPTHPDNLGGLGLLANVVDAFSVLLLAHGTMVAGMIASRVFYLGARLTDFKAEIGISVAFLLLVISGPFIMFAPQLARAKRAGLREYGTLAERYVRDFDTKWLRGGAPGTEALMGSADIQSLADMGNSFSVVRSMRVLPINRDAILLLATSVLAPIVPLLLTMMPVEDLVKKLIGLVL
jgi:hypothetical protein